jgi:outer membrane murein-binding lipoprotein Lpp
MTLKQIPIAAAIASALLIAGCASNNPPQLSGGTVPDQAAMQQDQLAGRTAMVWRAANLNPRAYTRFIVSPVQIYQGADAKWGASTDQDRQQLAQYLQQQFMRVLQQRNQLAYAPGPGVARINLILAGLDDNIPVVATVSRLAPAGLVINSAKSVGGQPGSFTGSVTIAGSIVDSQSNATLISFIQKRSPDALNIGATLSSRDAWEAAISQAAEAFKKRLEDVQTKGA